jgi:biopolymer transport protein ExbD
MGASVGTGGGKGDVNVELNIVPFIDLMSCLTAFLLVTAAWVKNAQLDTKPKSSQGKANQFKKEEEKPELSVLIQPDRIWWGVTIVNETGEAARPLETRRTKQGPEWAEVKDALIKIRTGPLKNATSMQVAAESLGSEDDRKVDYQDLIKLMDIAKSKDVGFIDVSLTDRRSLAISPNY